MDFPAHIREKKQEQDTAEAVQTVREHCRNTAHYAGRVLKEQALEESAFLAGLLHDAGKYTEKFRDYITKGSQGETVRRGSVNHTFAGVKYLLERYHQGEDAWQDLASELLSYAAGAHHGLFDCVGENRSNGFEHRKEKTEIDYEEAIGNFLADCAGQEELDRRFLAAKEELRGMLLHLFEMTERDTECYQEETLFYIGTLARLLLSAVIEGDRRDTAEFLEQIAIPAPMGKEERIGFWKRCLSKVENNLNGLLQRTELDRARRRISDQCRAFAEKPPGVYRLNVPTGSGKTLSSLRYALAHAAVWGKKRVIFTSPLLSILEQNAAVIRAYVQEDGFILEHHSNVVQTDVTKEELDRRELLEETWEAPIILTTMVQLLNTMFSGKTSSVRRFHSLCDSVIVIDEIQTLPSKLLSLFSLMVNFLTEVGGATVILCSATQPCMEALPHPIHEPLQTMVPFCPELWKPFQRTELRDKGSMSLEEMAEFARHLLEEVQSLLIVCNKKEEAERLYRLFRQREVEREPSDCEEAYAEASPEEIEVFHLSAAMCMAHRREVLKQVRASLKKEGKTLCISTQVIEAGVDISFRSVIRLTAGMDSVLQATGRCNREAEAGEGVTAPVYLISCKEERLSRLPDLQLGKDATIALLNEWRSHPERHPGDLYSEEAISFYYKKFYQGLREGHTEDMVCYKGSPLSLLDLLSQNSFFAEDGVPNIEAYSIRQAFGTAGRLFEVFEEDTTDVIVPYGRGLELIAALDGERAKRSLSYVKQQMEEAKPYTVSLYHYQMEALRKNGALHGHDCGAISLVGHYSNEVGFSMTESSACEEAYFMI